MSVVIDNPRFWGYYAVLLSDGRIIECHNYATAASIRDRYNATHKENNS